MTVYDPPDGSARSITTRALLDDLVLGIQIRLLAGADGLGREITHPRVQKSGLVLVGHVHGVVPGRVQILGETELAYIESLAADLQQQAARHLFGVRLSCVLVTRGVDPPRAFLDEANRTQTPLIVCQERSSLAITAVHTLLDERLAPRNRVHGVLVDVFEVGVLLLGRSGIGKSECALELVMRGHRLVADDVIECDYRPPGMVFGEPPPLLRHYIEVRGLGVLNIRDMYGVTAIRERKRLDLIVELELWRPDASYDRIGVEDRYRDILGVPIREVRLPVQPGRNMSSIIEIAARNELLRQAGHHPARDFIERVEKDLVRGPSSRPPLSSRLSPNESSAPPPVDSRDKS